MLKGQYHHGYIFSRKIDLTYNIVPTSDQEWKESKRKKRPSIEQSWEWKIKILILWVKSQSIKIKEKSYIRVNIRELNRVLGIIYLY